MIKRLPTVLHGHSEFRKHCLEAGGVVYLVAGVELDTLESVCTEFRFERVSPLVIEFAPTEPAFRRHWPWIAFAASQFEFETRQYQASNMSMLTPTEWKKLLERIRKNTDKLAEDLCTLQSAGYQLNLPSKPSMQWHLAWLDEFINQAIAGRLSPTVDESEAALWDNYQSKKSFLRTLSALSAAAEAAGDRLDADLLARGRGQNNPAITTFVRRLSTVWTSMTGRPASANTVNGGEDPDFVLFVDRIASMANGQNVSQFNVETALPDIEK